MTAAVEEQAEARTGGLSADLLEEQIKGNHLTANHHRAWMLDAVGQFDEQQLAETYGEKRRRLGSVANSTSQKRPRLSMYAWHGDCGSIGGCSTRLNPG